MCNNCRTQTHKHNPSFSLHLLCFYVTEQSLAPPECPPLSVLYFLSVTLSQKLPSTLSLRTFHRNKSRTVTCCQLLGGLNILFLLVVMVWRVALQRCRSARCVCLTDSVQQLECFLLLAGRSSFFFLFFFGSPNTPRMIKWRSRIKTHYLTDQPSDMLDVIWVFGLLKAACVADCVIKLNCSSRRNSVKWLW